CNATLNLNDDGEFWNFLSDSQHRVNLLDGTWLECDPRETITHQFLDQCNSFILFRNACGDDDAVDGCTISAGLRNKALATNLHLPQVWIQEHGVELGVDTWLKHVGELCDVGFQQLWGNLSATSELSPVSTVCSGCNNGRVNGGWGHASQHHWG